VVRLQQHVRAVVSNELIMMRYHASLFRCLLFQESHVCQRQNAALSSALDRIAARLDALEHLHPPSGGGGGGGGRRREGEWLSNLSDLCEGVIHVVCM
jgi:hypothetical protein